MPKKLISERLCNDVSRFSSKLLKPKGINVEDYMCTRIGSKIPELGTRALILAR
jgi:hypothetical protein